LGEAGGARGRRELEGPVRAGERVAEPWPPPPSAESSIASPESMTLADEEESVVDEAGRRGRRWGRCVGRRSCPSSPCRRHRAATEKEFSLPSCSSVPEDRRHPTPRWSSPASGRCRGEAEEAGHRAPPRDPAPHRRQERGGRTGGAGCDEDGRQGATGLSHRGGAVRRSSTACIPLHRMSSCRPAPHPSTPPHARPPKLRPPPGPAPPPA
jgi:hypothetical protein